VHLRPLARKCESLPIFAPSMTVMAFSLANLAGIVAMFFFIEFNGRLCISRLTSCTVYRSSPSFRHVVVYANFVFWQWASTLLDNFPMTRASHFFDMWKRASFHPRRPKILHLNLQLRATRDHIKARCKSHSISLCCSVGLRRFWQFRFNTAPE